MYELQELLSKFYEKVDEDIEKDEELCALCCIRIISKLDVIKKADFDAGIAYISQKLQEKKLSTTDELTRKVLLNFKTLLNLVTAAGDEGVSRANELVENFCELLAKLYKESKHKGKKIIEEYELINELVEIMGMLDEKDEAISQQELEEIINRINSFQSIEPKDKFVLIKELAAYNVSCHLQRIDELSLKLDEQKKEERKRRAELRKTKEEERTKELKAQEERDKFIETIDTLIREIAYANSKREIKNNYDFNENEFVSLSEFEISNSINRYDLFKLYCYIKDVLLPMYGKDQKSVIRELEIVIPIMQEYDKNLQLDINALANEWQAHLNYLTEKEKMFNNISYVNNIILNAKNEEEREKLFKQYPHFRDANEFEYYNCCLKLRDLVKKISDDINENKKAFYDHDFETFVFIGTYMNEDIETLTSLISDCDDYLEDLSSIHDDTIEQELDSSTIANPVIINNEIDDPKDVAKKGKGQRYIDELQRAFVHRFYMLPDYNSPLIPFGHGLRYSLLTDRKLARHYEELIGLMPARIRKSDTRITYIKININPKNIERLSKVYPSFSDKSVLFFVINNYFKPNDDTSYITDTYNKLWDAVSYNETTKQYDIVNYYYDGNCIDIKKLFEEEFTDEGFDLACQIIEYNLEYVRNIAKERVI